MARGEEKKLKNSRVVNTGPSKVASAAQRSGFIKGVVKLHIVEALDDVGGHHGGGGVHHHRGGEAQLLQILIKNI